MSATDTPAIMFDMDGLLLDTERLIHECFGETRRHFGLPESPQTILRCVGLRQEKTRDIISGSLGDVVGYDAFSLEYEARVVERLRGHVPEKHGATRLMQLLTGKGYTVGIATSTDTHEAHRLLENAGLLQYVVDIVGGDRVENHKPHPEVYQSLAARLGRTASQCVAFEDSEVGTRAAVASGAVTVQVPDLIAPSDEIRMLGHFIAPDLLQGAVMAGLLTPDEIAG